ncbi:unnamed protein product [Orchesella dallaii]|uniref:Guanine nucleotide-binding protein subunit beta-like protein n=1 Tax=Orchesella dallaii TaxID=48710 RepID=A0ABP1QAJ4_9HEXA
MCSPFPNVIFNREVYPISHGYSEILNPAFRPLVRQCFTKLENRKVFNTRTNAIETTNPVYDLQYSPVCSSSGDRMLAVGDEHGYLSVVKMPYYQTKTKVKPLEGKQTALMLGPYHNECEEMDEEERIIRESENINPVLYTLDWCACGEKIVAGYGDGSIRMWDLVKSRCYSTINAYTMSIKRVCWRNEAPTCVLSCSRSNAIEMHDLRMRVSLVNRINCAPLNCKLTDISVLDDNIVLSSSSNSSSGMIWDLRHTYKLYKRVVPVEKVNMGGNGVINMKYDGVNHVYALCDGGVIKKLNWRSGAVISSFRNPGVVDFFTKIDVCDADVLVCGTNGRIVYGYDTKMLGEYIDPFFSLKEPNTESLTEDDKENDTRTCCAVAIAKQRGSCDVGFAQIAAGGDDSAVTVWD